MEVIGVTDLELKGLVRRAHRYLKTMLSYGSNIVPSHLVYKINLAPPASGLYLDHPTLQPNPV